MLSVGLHAHHAGCIKWQHKHLPAPVRVIWRLIGRPKHERYRPALAE